MEKCEEEFLDISRLENKKPLLLGHLWTMLFIHACLQYACNDPVSKTNMILFI